jgi:hypothetical protein
MVADAITGNISREATILFGNIFAEAMRGLAPKVLPQSLLGKAVHYTLGQWPKLITFLEHGEVPLDNNRCENATVARRHVEQSAQSFEVVDNAGVAPLYRDCN